MEEGGANFETEGAFYNDRMEMNRDITVAVLRAWQERVGRDPPSYLDANCASGIRGVRAALADYDATLADRSDEAVALARRNVKDELRRRKRRGRTRGRERRPPTAVGSTS